MKFQGLPLRPISMVSSSWHGHSNPSPKPQPKQGLQTTTIKTKKWGGPSTALWRAPTHQTPPGSLMAE